MKTRLLKIIRSNLVIRYKCGSWLVSPIDCTLQTLFISDNTKQTINFIYKYLNIKLKRQQQTKLNRLIKVNH